MTFKGQPGKPRPTLKTIASITGLGISTVSRALQDGPEISENTKRRVRLVAEELGYSPDRAGVRLRTGKTNIISLVLDTHESALGVVSGLVYGVSDILAGTQYHLVLTPYDLDDPMKPVRYIAETRSADGVIFSRIQPQDPRVIYLHENGIPFATHGRTQTGLVHAYYDYDNEAYARQAVGMLERRGRRNLALFGPSSSFTYSQHLNTGFDAACRNSGIHQFQMGETNADSSLAAISEFGKDLAGQASRPDGIVASAFVPAIALIAGLEGNGIRIGRDVDIVTKRSSQLARYLRPDLLGIQEDFREAGRGLARAVIGCINGENPARFQTLEVPKIE